MTDSSQHSEAKAEGLSPEVVSRILAYTLSGPSRAEAEPPIRSFETTEVTLPKVLRIGRSVDRVLKRLEALNSH